MLLHLLDLVVLQHITEYQLIKIVFCKINIGKLVQIQQVGIGVKQIHIVEVCEVDDGDYQR
jgi:hypothetical protein